MSAVIWKKGVCLARPQPSREFHTVLFKWCLSRPLPRLNPSLHFWTLTTSTNGLGHSTCPKWEVVSVWIDFDMFDWLVDCLGFSIELLHHHFGTNSTCSYLTESTILNRFIGSRNGERCDERQSWDMVIPELRTRRSACFWQQTDIILHDWSITWVFESWKSRLWLATYEQVRACSSCFRTQTFCKPMYIKMISVAEKCYIFRGFTLTWELVDHLLDDVFPTWKSIPSLPNWVKNPKGRGKGKMVNEHQEDKLCHLFRRRRMEANGRPRFDLYRGQAAWMPELYCIGFQHFTALKHFSRSFRTNAQFLYTKCLKPLGRTKRTNKGKWEPEQNHKQLLLVEVPDCWRLVGCWGSQGRVGNREQWQETIFFNDN